MDVHWIMKTTVNSYNCVALKLICPVDALRVPISPEHVILKQSDCKRVRKTWEIKRNHLTTLHINSFEISNFFYDVHQQTITRT